MADEGTKKMSFEDRTKAEMERGKSIAASNAEKMAAAEAARQKEADEQRDADEKAAAEAAAGARPLGAYPHASEPVPPAELPAEPAGTPDPETNDSKPA